MENKRSLLTQLFYKYVRMRENVLNHSESLLTPGNLMGGGSHLVILFTSVITFGENEETICDLRN